MDDLEVLVRTLCGGGTIVIGLLLLVPTGLSIYGFHPSFGVVDITGSVWVGLGATIVVVFGGAIIFGPVPLAVLRYMIQENGNEFR